MNRFIMADAAKCIGCRTCEVACVVSHQENQDCATISSDAFVPRIQVIKDNAFTTAVACHQCEDAPCANVCPTHAIRREHGHIFVEQERCIGCKSCAMACPFGAPRYRVPDGKMVKCDGCNERVRHGLQPACVRACSFDALTCVTEEEYRDSESAKACNALIQSIR